MVLCHSFYPILVHRFIVRVGLGKCSHCIGLWVKASSCEVVNQIILTHRLMIWRGSSSQPAVRLDLVSKTIFPGDRKVAAIEAGTLQLPLLSTSQFTTLWPSRELPPPPLCFWRNCNNYEPHLLNSPLLTAADAKKAEKIPTTKFGKVFYDTCA